MKKLTTFLLVFFILYTSLIAHEQCQQDNYFFPKAFKTKSGKPPIFASDLKVYPSENPRIHRGIWPHFCVKHLLEDPEKCSSWTENEKGVGLEFLLEGSASSYIDKSLIQKLGNLLYLIPEKNEGYHGSCDCGWCSVCKQPLIRAVIVEEDEYDDENSRLALVYRCECTGNFWLDLYDLGKQERQIADRWSFCKQPTISPKYLDWHNQTYFHCLLSFLHYFKENPECLCYWPQVDKQAKKISNNVYKRLESSSILEDVLPSFSPYLINRTMHGYLTGLFIHAFFYSQYRNILADMDLYCLNKLSSEDYALVETRFRNIERDMDSSFLDKYNECLKKHPHPKIYYERGMILFHQGENLDALEDIRIFVSYAENHRYHDFLTSDLYLQEGRLLSESLSYDEAIQALTKAIEKDPKNFEAYFERAIAYFEKGDFSKALSDYLLSGFSTKQQIGSKKIGSLNYVTFSYGMTSGLIRGGQESISQFVPSTLSSFRGISKGIWAFVSNPIEISQDVIECAYACLKFIKDNTYEYLRYKLAPEIQECLKQWDQLDDLSKGRYIGHIIGKYGVDIFIGSGSIKAVQLYRDLRKANAIMTLETASISSQHAQEVLALSTKEWNLRQEVFKNGNLKIQWDKQGKHIPGHKNYVPKNKKSMLTHESPQKLIDAFAGTGSKVGHALPGKPGYKEEVNFQEIVGYYVNRDSGEKVATTWGRIHYAKDGVHIVPSKPKG